MYSTNLTFYARKSHFGFWNEGWWGSPDFSSQKSQLGTCKLRLPSLNGTHQYSKWVTVRGPLAAQQNVWEDAEPPQSLNEHVSGFRQWLYSATELASAKKKMTCITMELSGVLSVQVSKFWLGCLFTISSQVVYCSETTRNKAKLSHCRFIPRAKIHDQLCIYITQLWLLDSLTQVQLCNV